MSRLTLPRHVWIVGASSGLGLATARELARAGCALTISARASERLQQAANELQCEAVVLDLTSVESIEAAVARVYEGKRPDMVWLNAAFYEPPTPGQFSAAAFHTHMATNFLGVMELVQVVLPQMRSGERLLLSASVAGYCGLPHSAPYSSSKAALINFAESMRPELQQRGILLQLLNPGFIRTPMTDKNRFPMPFLMQPEAAAKRLVGALQSDRFEITFPRRLTRLMKLLRLLPYPLFFALTRRMLRPA